MFLFSFNMHDNDLKKIKLYVDKNHEKIDGYFFCLEVWN